MTNTTIEQTNITNATGPLAATLARVSAVDEDLAAEVGPLEGDWFPAADMWDLNKPLLDQALELSVAGYPGAEVRTAGSFLGGHYVWFLLIPAIATYLAEDRAPDLHPDNVAMRSIMHRHEGENGEVHEHPALAVRFLSGRFAALPGDPAADAPDAVILPDRAAIREWVRLRLEQHIAPFFDAVYSKTRLGKRAQWNLAADASAQAFLWAGKLLGSELHGSEEGLQFVKMPSSPMLNPKTGFITLEYAGHKETFATRGGCCLYYKVPGGHHCSTCVLRPEAERNSLLLDYMAKKYTEAVPA